MKQAYKKGNKNIIGAYGEQVAVNYLKRKGISIIELNCLKKWGEIDIVARETDKIRFIEVKTVSYGTIDQLKASISHETYKPEDNVHYKKLARLNRAIESWIMENNYSGEWEIDVLAVRIVVKDKYASVKYLPNIIMG